MDGMDALRPKDLFPSCPAVPTANATLGLKLGEIHFRLRARCGRRQAGEIVQEKGFIVHDPGDDERGHVDRHSQEEVLVGAHEERLLLLTLLVGLVVSARRPDHER